jgi:hypothetical protein
MAHHNKASNRGVSRGFGFSEILGVFSFLLLLQLVNPTY